MKTVLTDSHPVQIFIAGDYEAALASCQVHCDEVGLCVTVTPTTYVYTGGQEPGVIVGFINYGRFPLGRAAIFERARELALKLIADLGQESASVQGPDDTLWISFRKEPGA